MLQRLIRLLVAFALVSVVSTAARADLLADVVSRGVIRIGVPADLIPFGYQNVNREPEGFDIDLANMLAKSLGVKAELIPITGANRIPYLLTDKVDITVSLMGLTPERAKQVMFSAPYASTSLAVFGPKSINVKSAADLKKYKVAATRGNTEETSLTAMAPQADIMRTENDATTIAAYLSGQAQLFAASSFVPIELAKKNPGKEFDLKFIIRPSPGCMGVKMGEHNMLRWLDSFIYFNKMNGELDKLHHKWLGRGMDPLPSI
jgi:polar amino acid transport system substrate-binding protein